MQPALSSITLPDAQWLTGGAVLALAPASPSADEPAPIRVAAGVLAQRANRGGVGRPAVTGVSRSR